MRNWLKFLFLATVTIVVVLGVDQGSKWASRSAVASIEESIVTYNGGISFGWQPFGSLSWGDNALVLAIISLLLMVVIWCRDFWFKHPILLGSFIGGAISNLVDRVIWGGVQDWIPVGRLWGWTKLPGTTLQNNVADWVIVLVLLRLFLELVVKSRHSVQLESS